MMNKKREKELKEDASFWFEGWKATTKDNRELKKEIDRLNNKINELERENGRLKLDEIKRARELGDDPVSWTVSCDCRCENESPQSLSRRLFGYDLF